MYRCRYIYIICLVCYSLYSCHGHDKKDIINIIEEWNNKEVVFPNTPIFTKFVNDTVIGYFEKECDYKILTYIDSIGCLRCNLKFNAWRPFINMLQDTFPQCNVLIFIHPRSRRSVETLLKTENIDFPVCIDDNDSINKLNHFPSQMQFQTLLLDKDNKVLAMGNPVLNPKIKELYFKIIFGEKNVTYVEKILTCIDIEKKYISMGRFDWKQEQTREFVLTNVGRESLIIEDVITSCSCIDVKYIKEPVRMGKSLRLTVNYKAEYPEYFDKTITVYCNAKGSPFQLRISGTAK